MLDEMEFEKADEKTVYPALAHAAKSTKRQKCPPYFATALVTVRNFGLKLKVT